MAFSATLTLSDLNDYLAPSQACIRPVEEEDKVEQIDGAKTQIHIDESTGAYYELALPNNLPSTVSSTSTVPAPSTEKKKLKKAEISLNDCLACSGCITTSQELLLQTHSLTPLLELLPPNEPTKTLFLSISPQSLSSISASLPTPLPLSTLLHRIQSFLPSIGIPHIADLTFARHLSLSETVQEFYERKAGQGGGLPMLASGCPGWICYAEKAHGEVLEKVGKGRSAMGIMGGLVKGWWARRNSIDSKAIYHVSVQPCYDRKLESSRTQFISTMTNQPETDLVLTTGEFHSFLLERGFDPNQPTNLEKAEGEVILPETYEGFPSMVDHPGSSSDAYLHALLFHFIEKYPPGSLTLATTPIRGSPDYIEYSLTVNSQPAPSLSPSSTSNTLPPVTLSPSASTSASTSTIASIIPTSTSLSSPQANTSTASSSLPGYLPLPPPNTQIFRAAKCYGFKNLQNVVRKSKPTSSALSSRPGLGRAAAKDKTYDYVEVMACPSGCVNGGGQLKPPSPLTSNSGEQQQPQRGVKRDEEGFVRPWEETDTQLAQVQTGPTGVDVEMRWSTKEWVARVEAIYWGDLSSSSSSSSTTTSAKTKEASVAPLRPAKAAAAVPSMSARRIQANELENVVRDEMSSAELASGTSDGKGWIRTSYEAIKQEGDGLLLGSGVVW
ncbi:iron hydrogenase [Phaffia rhodozyma]|uniref:Iron hydrogenase n=1 Tax=Phaffia rhodozyma TaxID=264483 RepID=A0A0F7SJG7_PHARH|nr:iron hydrogenase [Phaffia rhodozyma]